MRVPLPVCLLILPLAAMAACTGQPTTHHPSKPAGDTVAHQVTRPIGDTVAGLDKEIWRVFQDSRNNYWFGSNTKGVYRYDGKTLKNFTTQHGLCHNQIREIQEDQSGNLYFNTHAGISKFDGATFTTLQVTPTFSDSQAAWKLEPGDLWFQGPQEKNGPYRYDGKVLYDLKFPKSRHEDTFYAKFPNVTFSPYQPYCTYRDSKGNVWFGTSSFGAVRYDGNTITWMDDNELVEIDGGPSMGVRGILEDSNGDFWLGNTQYRYTIGENGASHKKQPGMYVEIDHPEGFPQEYMSIAQDNQGDYWIAINKGGVWRYDGKTHTHYPIKAANELASVFSIYKDRQGTLWLGTTNAGAYRFNGKAFEPFLP